MKFSIERDLFLEPLQAVQGVVERRQSLPILLNVLLRLDDDGVLSVTASDLEVEITARVNVTGGTAGEITVPARKLTDIVRSLASGVHIDIALDESRLRLKAGRGRFSFSTLPATDFPASESVAGDLEVVFAQKDLRRLIELTHFAMAHQDVRYYLNGLLFEIGAGKVRAVATDGHRLALCDLAVDKLAESEIRQVIVPRKAAGELLRLLADGEEARVDFASNVLKVDIGSIQLSSKLIDGRFPDYTRVIPDEEKCDKRLELDKEALRQILARTAILSNDKYRAVRLVLEPNLLRVAASNPEQEEAEDCLEIEYAGESIEIGFNVSYLIEALGAVPSEHVSVFLTDSGSSCLIRPLAETQVDCEFVVMPLRL